MPYIKFEDRVDIADWDEHFEDIVKTGNIDNAGEMQFAIATLINSYMERKGLNYQNCNDVMGALAGAQMEFYRRTVAPYEDLKIKQNGDVQ